MNRDIIAAVNTLYMKVDAESSVHQQRVGNLAKHIAMVMKFKDHEIENCFMAGSMHDIGKISIPPQILHKHTPLTTAEFNLIREHVMYSVEIAESFKLNADVIEAIQDHHERLDGTGYPKGKTAKNMSVVSKIVSVSDVVEAMSSLRAYRDEMGVHLALKEISDQSRYDVEVFLACRSLVNSGYKFSPRYVRPKYLISTNKFNNLEGNEDGDLPQTDL